MYTLRATLFVVCALVVSTLAYKIPVRNKRSSVPTLSPCTGSSQLEWLPHPTICQKYFICWGDQHTELSCGLNTSWEPFKKVCVEARSDKDVCYHAHQHISSSSEEDPKGIFIGEVPTSCEYGVVGIIPHPLKCAQYFDCSDNTAYAFWETHLKECDYPMLFDAGTGNCRHYSQVSCGSRVEATNPCDYQRNQCVTAHCSPCSIRFPDCKGLPDGDNPWKGKEETPQFCSCQQGRVIREDTCPESQIFDPENRKCVDSVYYFKYTK